MCVAGRAPKLLGMTATKASLLVLVAVAGALGAAGRGGSRTAGGRGGAVRLTRRQGLLARDQEPPVRDVGACAAGRAVADGGDDLGHRGQSPWWDLPLRRPLRLSAAAGDSGENGHRDLPGLRLRDGRSGAGRPQRRSSRHRLAAGEDLDGGWRADVGDLETRQLFVEAVARSGPHAAAAFRGRRSGCGPATPSAAPCRSPGDIPRTSSSCSTAAMEGCRTRRPAVASPASAATRSGA